MPPPIFRFTLPLVFRVAFELYCKARRLIPLRSQLVVYLLEAVELVFSDHEAREL